ncbi:MAG: lipid A biosynthesis protein [bacterium]|nr:lipid A biosynthesis protein [bacterium]
MSNTGQRRFLVLYVDGTEAELSPEGFAELLHTHAAGKSLIFRFLNITSSAGIAWVILGLAGQIAFAGRMVLQWILSEHNKRSVVPVGFWWMSLAGASMLLVYFIWRRDIVGVLGQSTGWLIYTRNLWLIYCERLSVLSLASTKDPNPTS